MTLLKSLKDLMNKMHEEGDGGLDFKPKLKQRYDVECFGPDGKLKWKDWFFNTNPTVGLNKYLQFTLVSGLAAPAWYVGLVGSSHTYAAGDTMTSHGSWTESSAYSQATRPAFTPGVVSGASVDNSSNKAAFSINNTDTINGCFLCDNNGKGTGTGTLLGEGDFTGGAKSVASGDTLNVQVTCSLS